MKQENKNTEKNTVSDKKKDRPQNKNLKPPFKPGESGNPEGRPKGKLNFDTRVDMAIQVLALKYVKEFNKKNPGKKITLDDVDIEGDIFSQYLNKARNGDVKILTDYLDRRHGKAMQPVQLSGQGGGPIAMQLLEAEKDIAEWEARWFAKPETPKEETAPVPGSEADKK